MIRRTISWIVGIFFIIALVGIGYYYYVYQVDSAYVVHEHTQMVAKRILELQEKLDRNGVLATEILKNNHELLKRLDEGLANHMLEMKAHRAFILESHENIHNDIESVFERLSSEFEKNRELHRATQRFLKVPQEGK